MIALLISESALEALFLARTNVYSRYRIMGKKPADKKPASSPKGVATKKETEVAENLDTGSRKVIGKIIEDFNEFKAKWEKSAKDPAQSVLFFLVAVYNHEKDQAKGEAMATVVLAKSFLVPDPKSRSGFKLYQGDRTMLDNMASMSEVVRSYLGGTPANRYKIDPQKLVMMVVSAGFSGNDGTITIESSGKDYATPINVVKNESGQWKVASFAPAATSVKK